MRSDGSLRRLEISSEVAPVRLLRIFACGRRQHGQFGGGAGAICCVLEPFSSRSIGGRWLGKMCRHYLSVSTHFVCCRSGERDEGKMEEQAVNICLAVGGDR
jgi:hypothetical protein